MKTYKDLQVWRLNQMGIKDVLGLMRDLPQEYAFQHIAKQLFRAVSSVGANLAEGQDSYEGKEFTRYINIAIRSAIESDHWLATLENLTGERKQIQKIMSDNVEVIKMLKGLKKSIETKRNH